jgi:probable rRNA maturation factor
MITLKIDPEFTRLFPSNILEKAAEATLIQQSTPEADLSVVLTGDKQIQVLNSNFLGMDAPTDVLSFPASETDPETGRLYLGDIIISVQRAESQCTAAGHSLEDELCLLVVHGVLHLLGHDHAEIHEKKQMWIVQKEILVSLGISPTIVHE